MNANEVLAIHRMEKPGREAQRKIDEECHRSQVAAEEKAYKNASQMFAIDLFDHFIDAFELDVFQQNVLQKIKDGGSPVIIAYSECGMWIYSDFIGGREIIDRVKDIHGHVFADDVARWYPLMITNPRFCHVFHDSMFNGWRLRAMRKGFIFKEILITLEKIN